MAGGDTRESAAGQSGQDGTRSDFEKRVRTERGESLQRFPPAYRRYEMTAQALGPAIGTAMGGGVGVGDHGGDRGGEGGVPQLLEEVGGGGGHERRVEGGAHVEGNDPLDAEATGPGGGGLDALRRAPHDDLAGSVVVGDPAGAAGGGGPGGGSLGLL